MDTANMTVAQLKAILRERKKKTPNCKPYSKLRKTELVQLVNETASQYDKLKNKLTKIETAFNRKSKLVFSAREKDKKAKIERRINRAKNLQNGKLTAAIVDRLEREVNALLDL